MVYKTLTASEVPQGATIEFQDTSGAIVRAVVKSVDPGPLLTQFIVQTNDIGERIPLRFTNNKLLNTWQ